MIENKKKYDNYKPSGVEWLGEIPSHWEVKRLKNICSINQNSLPEDTNKSFAFDYVDIGSVTFEEGITKTENFTFKNAPSRARRLAKVGDTIVSTVRTYLKAIDYVDSSKSDFVYSTGFAVLNPSKIDSNFLSLIIKSDSFTNQVDVASKGMSYPAINSTDLSRLVVIVPPLAEQTAIAAYLDEKTEQIDTAIAQKQRMIALLKERQQILIHKAVTQGLDPSVKMKNSGVEWIGNVPEHWEVKRLKYIFESIQTGTTPSTINQNFFDGEIDWYNPKDLNNEILVSSERKLSDLAIERREIKYFPKDSILIVGIGATTGKTSYMTKKSTFNQQITGFNSQKHFNKYYFYLLHSLSKVLLNTANYTTLPILNNEFFKSFILITPPIEEQKSIVNFIEAVTQKLTTAIHLKEQEITKLKEYKSSLINSVVTGKVKVS